MDQVPGLFGVSQRLPPANIEAEQALLGALLANGKTYDRVGEFLRPEHFADPVHAAIFGAIQRRIEAGGVADAMTLRAEFEHSGVLDDVGGVGYLTRLLSAMVGIINAGEYGRVIQDAWLRRQMIDVGEALVNRAFGMEPELDARAVLARADEDLLALQPGGAQAGLMEGVDVARKLMIRVDEALARKGGLPGITTGLRGLDRMLGGLRAGQLVVVAGRPSMGKTALANRMIFGAGRAGARVLFVSAEMLAEDVMARMACADAGLPLTAYTHAAIEGPDGRLRPLDRDERARLDRAAQSLGAANIVWDDTTNTVGAIRARARRLKRQAGGLDAIVVDYLTRLRPPPASTEQNQHRVVGAIAAGLKDLAKQLAIPVVLLAQLSRKVEEREDKTPNLADLRESGTIEEEADVVIFLYRLHYYLVRSRPQKGPKEKMTDYEARLNDWTVACRDAEGKALAIVAKQRQGRIGPVRLRWHDDSAQFSDESEGEG